jgi:diguanylate cyclase (GGDEF)-like protein
MVEMQAALIERHEALAHQATHDPLTGMFNRRAILDHLNKKLAHTRRHGQALAVGICDIDHFKQINDTHGHQTGDDILCELAASLKEALREDDTVGRMGGEEFLIVSTMQAGSDGLTLFARIRSQIAQTALATRSGGLHITISIGVATAVAGSTVDSLLERGDLALYQAKNEGRNRVVLAPTPPSTATSGNKQVSA